MSNYFTTRNELSSKKIELLAALERGFGINSLQEIRLWVCNPDENWEANNKVQLPTQEKDAYIGL